MVKMRFTSIKLVSTPCTLGVGCEEYGVCYAAAHGEDAQCGSSEHVVFTLQSELGKIFTFKHPNFEQFCAKAIALVKRPFQVVDTDQLIGHWFEA